MFLAGSTVFAAIASASAPLMRIMAMPPAPLGVAIAAIVSFNFIINIHRLQLVFADIVNQILKLFGKLFVTA